MEVRRIAQALCAAPRPSPPPPPGGQGSTTVVDPRWPNPRPEPSGPHTTRERNHGLDSPFAGHGPSGTLEEKFLARLRPHRRPPPDPHRPAVCVSVRYRRCGTFSTLIFVSEGYGFRLRPLCSVVVIRNGRHRRRGREGTSDLFGFPVHSHRRSPTTPLAWDSPIGSVGVPSGGGETLGGVPGEVQ